MKNDCHVYSKNILWLVLDGNALNELNRKLFRDVLIIMLACYVYDFLCGLRSNPPPMPMECDLHGCEDNVHVFQIPNCDVHVSRLHSD